MKPTLPWHFTRWGRVILWLGSVQLAVPVLVFVAVALAWGTYLESTQNAKTAKATVYLSWWFIGLMAAVCVSLIFAVATRFPWKRRHAGFMIVHASLVAMIAAGFWSLFGRVEGRLAIQEGATSGFIETEEELLELVEHQAGQFRVLGAAPAPSAGGTLSLGGYTVRVSERWNNTREEFDVLDDGPEPYRAVEVAFSPNAPHGFWVGEETKGGPANLDGLTIRLLPAGAEFQPPRKEATEAGGYFFLQGDRKAGVREERQEVLPGWTITSIRRFERALVSADGIVESPTGRANPAIEVTISDGQGTVERHTAFQEFPDMVLSKAVEGSPKSGARLVASGGSEAGEALVLFGQPPALQGAYLNRDGSVTPLAPSALPWTFEAGGRSVTIRRQFTRARESSRFVRAPDAAEHRPALVAGVGDATPTPLAWKSMIAAGIPGRTAMLRYGPRSIPLPFTVRLDDFRKTDYPGTAMAMAYESDVTVFRPGQPDESVMVHMNNPLVSHGWKVYQSGFMGENLSIFSVMKDPGLPLTYLSSITLCLGIVITFYSRRLSWGHPGIPTPFAKEESTHASTAAHPDVAVAAARAGAGATPPGTVDGTPGLDPDPRRRAGDAAGHVRAELGGPTHGTGELVGGSRA